MRRSQDFGFGNWAFTIVLTASGVCFLLAEVPRTSSLRSPRTHTPAARVPSLRPSVSLSPAALDGVQCMKEAAPTGTERDYDKMAGDLGTKAKLGAKLAGAKGGLGA